jgi:1-acyl-sn-glycerol-3-phosphate acyltransferase
LKPLVASPVNGNSMPPGGTLRARIHQELKAGHSVLVLADGPVGVPAHLSRFRLDAFHAAIEAGAPVQPIGLLGTSQILEPGRLTSARDEARVLVGQPIRLLETDLNGLAGRREQVRDALVRLLNTEL